VHGIHAAPTLGSREAEDSVFFFLPFPKPHLNRDKCLLWIKLCGRPQHQLNVDKLNKNGYICSKLSQQHI